MSSVQWKARELVLGYRNIAFSQAPSSFELPRAKIVALVGLNGSGKSTLLKVMLGEPYRLGGDLFFEGDTPIQQLKLNDYEKTFAYLSQEQNYPSHLTVADLLRLVRISGVSFSPSEMDSMAHRFSIQQLVQRKLGDLSCGERQRVFLSFGFLKKPKVFLLDEPTNHLDPLGVQQFWQTLRANCDGTKMSLFVSTHDLRFVRKHCDWVCAMKSGSVVFSGPSEPFFQPATLQNVFGNSQISY